MSTFTVTARRIRLQPIENADRLELALIDGTEYMAVVQKGLHADGDLIVYIPEQAILTDEIIAEMGLVSEDGSTMLAGGTLNPDGSKKRNRVKALRLRGTLSQGLVYRHTGSLGELVEGTDYAEALGIVKYVPPVPVNMAGKVEPAAEMSGYTDIENIKYFPHVLADDEEVIAAEKLHGTCSIMVLTADGEFLVSSKGYASQHLAIVPERDGEGKLVNVYHRIAEKFGIEGFLRELAAERPGRTLTLFGETLGVQDLMYGLQKGQLDFRAFDLRIGDRYLDYDEFLAVCGRFGVPVVPILYRGPYSRTVIEEVATGREQLTGREQNIREGVVVRPTTERRDPELGRVILKVISPKYLLRKGEDTTEFE